MFCEDHQTLFCYIWEKYQALFNARIDAPDYFRPGYTHFLCFILFLLSMQTNDVAKFIYFAWFYVPKILPQMSESKTNKVKFRIYIEDMDELLANLWGAKNGKKLTKYKAKLRNAVRDESIDALTLKQFKSFNLRTSVAFSQPVVDMMHQLKRNMIGKTLWSRVHQLFQKFARHPKEAIALLDDSDLFFYSNTVGNTGGAVAKFTRPGTAHSVDGTGSITGGSVTGEDQSEITAAPKRKAKTVYRSLGERREARRELQPFLKLLKLYLEIPPDGFKVVAKRKRIRQKPKKTDGENGDNEGDGENEEDEIEGEEEDDSLVALVKNFAGIMRAIIFGAPKASKVKPEAAVNPVLAKYASNYSVASNATASTGVAESKMGQSEVDSDFESKGNTTVPGTMNNTDTDLDSVVDSIISAQYSMSLMYSDVLQEPLAMLRGRAVTVRYIAEEVNSVVESDFKRIEEEDRANKKRSRWGR